MTRLLKLGAFAWCAVLCFAAPLPAAATTGTLLGYFKNADYMPEVNERAVTLGIGFLPTLSGKLLLHDGPALFSDRPWTVADVGTTRWISAGPLFDQAVTALTDGSTDYPIEDLTFVRIDGGPPNSSNPVTHLMQFKSPIPGAVDLKGLRIEALGLHVSALEFDVAPWLPSALERIYISPQVLVDYAPMPEPSIGLAAVTAGLWTLLGRPRRAAKPGCAR